MNVKLILDLYRLTVPKQLVRDKGGQIRHVDRRIIMATELDMDAIPVKGTTIDIDGDSFDIERIAYIVNQRLWNIHFSRRFDRIRDLEMYSELLVISRWKVIGDYSHDNE